MHSLSISFLLKNPFSLLHHASFDRIFRPPRREAAWTTTGESMCRWRRTPRTHCPTLGTLWLAGNRRQISEKLMAEFVVLGTLTSRNFSVRTLIDTILVALDSLWKCTTSLYIIFSKLHREGCRRSFAEKQEFWTSGLDPDYLRTIFGKRPRPRYLGKRPRPRLPQDNFGKIATATILGKRPAFLRRIHRRQTPLTAVVVDSGIDRSTFWRNRVSELSDIISIS